ncbi:MAG: hypothetical protein WCD70_10575 [Alphaproteobacteria bacterium]
MTEAEYGKRLALATSFHDEVEAMRDFRSSEITEGRARDANFQRDFFTRFRAPYALKDSLQLAKDEVLAVLSNFAVRSCASIMETLEKDEKDRTYVIGVITERPLTEAEELALPICPQGVPVMHNAASPFDFWAPHSVGGKIRPAGTLNL